MFTSARRPGLAALLAAAHLAALVLGGATADAQTWEGTTVRVVDGDTIAVLTPERVQVRVRLAQVDAPERDQPYSNRSRQLLSGLVLQKQVRCEVEDTDRHGRVVARVYAGDVDVGAELVRQGAAWVYRKYAHDPALYEVEEQARREGRGLWGLPQADRTPPWEWRRGGGQPSPPARIDPSASDSSCGSKRYCREMSSCAEARFYPEACGLTRLD
jgi:endonuclease YncB( thermonuclease family)